MSYLFFLGRSEELGLAELTAFFQNPQKLLDDLYLINAESFVMNGKELPISESLTALGGTVKVAEFLGTVPEFTAMTIAQLLAKEAPGKITFGVSTYGTAGKFSQKMCEEVKGLLELEGRKIRYVLPSEGSTLTSVVVAKQGVTEINVVPSSGAFIISKTIAVQEFEEWSRRDFDRPFYDSKKGMLPPKVARMVVNIALGREAKGKTLLDPFCGMGTIPGEALLRGAIAMGSDNAKDAIEKAKKNSIWLRNRDATLPPVTYFVSDATHVSEFVRSGTIDAIVTEPFMGSPKLGLGKITNPKEIRNAIKGLEKLYIGCLRDWYSLLKTNGVICMALPEIDLRKTKYFVKSIIDSCETLGYTREIGPLPYSRPHAVVRRMFYVIKKNT